MRARSADPALATVRQEGTASLAKVLIDADTDLVDPSPPRGELHTEDDHNNEQSEVGE